MATQIVCDHPYRQGICGEIVEGPPVEVKIDGKTYALEICQHHGQPIRDLVEAVGAKPVSSSSSGHHNSNGHRRPRKVVDLTDAAVRAWAQEHKVKVAPLGRVSNAVREQYVAAQK